MANFNFLNGVLSKGQRMEVNYIHGGSAGLIDFYGVLPSGMILGKVNGEGIVINPDEVRDIKFNERAIDNCTPLPSNADNFIQ